MRANIWGPRRFFLLNFLLGWLSFKKNVFDSECIILWCYQKRFIFSLGVFPSDPCPDHYSFTLLRVFNPNVSRLESEWQQVTSRLHYSSSYFGRSQQYCSFDGLTCPLVCKSFSPCINPLMTVPSTTIIISNTVTLNFLKFFSSQGTFRFLSVLPCAQPDQQSLLFSRFFFFCIITVMW